MRSEVIVLFRDVADRSPEEREAYYDREQVPDALRVEVESLLRYDMSRDSLGGYVGAARLLLGGPSPEEAHADIARKSGLPERIGRFEVTRLLGRGGMGDVYLARDPVIDRPVAIKLIAGGLEDDAARRRLVREARTAGRLHHPNIVTVFEAGEHENGSYIAMEYVPGETLGSIIRRRAPLALRRRLEMMEGACAGLAHAHRAGVVHLDIKPDNLMLDDSRIVKVLDFGISRVLQNEALFTMHVAGTLRYMSPEQVQGKPLDHRSDVFSLGCSLYEIISYAPAYSGSTKEIVNQIALGPVPSLLEACPELDPRLDEIVCRAMALEPSERYDDLEELRAAIADVRATIDPADDGALSHTAGVAAEPAAQGGSAARPSRRSRRTRAAWQPRAAIAGGVGAAGLAAVAVFFAWGAPESTSNAPIVPEASSRPAAAAASPDPAPTATTDVVQAEEPTDELWLRVARDDRAGVLEWLQTSARGRGPEGVKLAREVMDTIRPRVLQARDAAAAIPGRSTHDAYRSGTRELERATQLAGNGQAIESLRALWRASDLYARALAAPAPPPAAEQPPAPAATETSAAPDGPADIKAAASPIQQPPPPDRSSLATSSTIAGEPEIPAATTAPAATPAPTQAEIDAEAIRETLGRYEAAYEALDLAALLEVFPSLDRGQVEQLRTTFDTMRSYEVDIRVTSVQVTNDTASVTAGVARRITPRVGSRPEAYDVDTEFRLRRADSGWTIVGVEGTVR